MCSGIPSTIWLKAVILDTRLKCASVELGITSNSSILGTLWPTATRNTSGPSVLIFMAVHVILCSLAVSFGFRSDGPSVTRTTRLRLPARIPESRFSNSMVSVVFRALNMFFLPPWYCISPMCSMAGWWTTRKEQFVQIEKWYLVFAGDTHHNLSRYFLSLLLWPWRRLVILVELWAQTNKPFAVVSALQSVFFFSYDKLPPVNHWRFLSWGNSWLVS